MVLGLGLVIRVDRIWLRVGVVVQDKGLLVWG